MQLSQTINKYCLRCFFTVIGGKNIYLRLSVRGECDKNVSVWETLVKEVLSYSGLEITASQRTMSELIVDFAGHVDLVTKLARIADSTIDLTFLILVWEVIRITAGVLGSRSHTRNHYTCM